MLSGLGQMVCPHLRRLADEQDNALIVAQNYKLLKQAPLRVGILPTFGPARIGRFLGVFRDQNPGVELAVSEGSVATLAKRLASADLDVAVANSAGGLGDEFRAELLYNERYVVIFPPGHHFAQLDTVRLATTSLHSCVKTSIRQPVDRVGGFRREQLP